MSTEGRRFLTIAQAADFLQINVKTCYSMAALGELPAVRVGRRTLRIDGRRLSEQLEVQLSAKGRAR
jgi:excisionase family DNA binding protein